MVWVSYLVSRASTLPTTPRPWFWLGKQDHRELIELCALVVFPSGPNSFGLSCAVVSPRHAHTCPIAGQGQDTVCARGTAFLHMPVAPVCTSACVVPPYGSLKLSSDQLCCPVLTASCTLSSTYIQFPFSQGLAEFAHCLPSGTCASDCGQHRTPVPNWQCGYPPMPDYMPPARGTCSVNTFQFLSSVHPKDHDTVPRSLMALTGRILPTVPALYLPVLLPSCFPSS